VRMMAQYPSNGASTTTKPTKVNGTETTRSLSSNGGYDTTKYARPSMPRTFSFSAFRDLVIQDCYPHLKIIPPIYTLDPFSH
jgi:hypothetical protein